MKNRALFLISIVAVLISACNNTKNSSDKENNQIDSELVKSAKTNGSDSKESKVIYLTNESFKQKVFNYEINQEWKYEGEIPCIVDFYADWCGPCKMIAPTLDELSKEYDGKVIIYKVDTDKQQELAAAFGIRSIPSLLFVPLEGQPQMAQGAMQKEGFVQAIEEVLLKQVKNEQSKS